RFVAAQNRLVDFDLETAGRNRVALQRFQDEVVDSVALQLCRRKVDRDLPLHRDQGAVARGLADLPLADRHDETGLVVPIGEWVIRQAARDCALIPVERQVAINLSATQLKRDGIDNFILETLKSHTIPPGRFEIEVNETILGRNEAVAFSRLEKIRDAGVRIVMDSFGVATLSLGLLARYSFDKIKIDRSFLMDDEHKGGAVLAAVCSLGRTLGFRVAGQGVETVEHAQLLRAAGCSE